VVPEVSKTFEWSSRFGTMTSTAIATDEDDHLTTTTCNGLCSDWLQNWYLFCPIESDLSGTIL